MAHELLLHLLVHLPRLKVNDTRACQAVNRLIGWHTCRHTCDSYVARYQKAVTFLLFLNAGAEILRGFSFYFHDSRGQSYGGQPMRRKGILELSSGVPSEVNEL